MLLIPQLCFPEPVAFAGSAAELEGGMCCVGLDLQVVVQPLDKVHMPAAEVRHRQDTDQQLAIVTWNNTARTDTQQSLQSTLRGSAALQDGGWGRGAPLWTRWHLLLHSTHYTAVLPLK